MKKLLFDAFLLIFLTVASFWLVLSLKPVEVKILCYNVQHCVGMDTIMDYDRTAGVIIAQQPDIVALQELDSMTKRSKCHYQLGELASRTAYHDIFGKAIEFDSGTYGIGVLTREMPLSTRSIALPGDEPRLLLMVEMKNYVLACTHLDLEEEPRLESVPLIVEEAKLWEKPFILAGDFNDSIDSPLLIELTKHFTINSGDEPTFPADVPNERIDYVATFKSRPATTIDSEVISDTMTSDHRPLVVKLQLPK